MPDTVHTAVENIYSHGASDQLASWSVVVLLEDSSPLDHTERERRGEERQCNMGGRTGGSWLQWGRKQRYGGTPFAWQWDVLGRLGDSSLVLIHLCQQGHLVVPPPLCHCPKGPGGDDYHLDREVRITLLVAERQRSWTWKRKAAQCGLASAVRSFHPLRLA